MPNWTAEDGSKINYEIEGNPEHPPLLLLPGLLGTVANQWQSFARTLSAHFLLIMMDLRGHGRSTNNADSLNPETMMFDVSGLLDSLNIATVHVAGYSLGGYLGLMLALKDPRRVSTLLMHASKFYWTKDAAEKMHQQLDPELMAQKVPTYADQLVKDHGARQWRVLVRQAADQTTYLLENGINERMAVHAQCPVLVSVGDRDELVPITEAMRLARLFDQGELLVLPGVRHPFQTIRPIPLIPMMQYFHREF